jgi:Sulfite exporter TauE/SafE
MTSGLLYVLLGLIAGAFSGLIGIGGGVIIVPALVFLFGLSQHQAQGTTLALLVPLKTTPRRIASQGLGVRTPIPGLYLARQDVATPGTPGAMYGGVLAAAAIEPQIYRHLSS